MKDLASGDILLISDGWEEFGDAIVAEGNDLEFIGLPSQFVYAQTTGLTSWTDPTGYQKRLQYILNKLLPSYIFYDGESDTWKELMSMFLKYMDQNVYQKIIELEKSLNVKDTDDDNVIEEFYNQFGGKIINEDILKIQIQDKKKFTELGKFINNLKGTKLSIEYLFKYLSQSQIVQSDNKKVLEYVLKDIREDESLLEIDTTPNPKLFVSPFTYHILTNEVFEDLPKIIKTTHPAGFNYLVLYEDLLNYADSFIYDSESCRSILLYTNKYNGMYKRMGVKTITGTNLLIQNKPILGISEFTI